MLIRFFAIALASVMLATALSACGGSAPAELEDAAISSSDVPGEWLPTDLDDAQGQALFDTLPKVLASDAEARMVIHAFEAETGLHGAATLFIETDAESAIPETEANDELLGPLSLLLAQEDALLLPNPRGGDPNAYFAVSETPVPGSIRSRLVRLIDTNLVHSDSLTFNVGNVLAVVTVWYPEDEGPTSDIDEIASRVQSSLQSLVADS